MHAFSLTNRLPNGKDSGIVVIIRDHRGATVKMYFGTIRNRTKSGNKLWSLIVSLRGTFVEGENLIILETGNSDAIKEWEDWKWYLDPNNKGLIQHFEQRNKDPNLVLKVNVVSASENLLACYLPHDGVEKRTRLMLFRRMFGRVKEIWMLDMRLGPCEGDFGAPGEDEYDDLMLEAEEEDEAVVEISDDESKEVVEGVEAADDDGGQEVQMAAKV